MGGVLLQVSDNNTWKSNNIVDKNIAGTGYFQCTSAPLSELADNVATNNSVMNGNLNSNALQTRYLALTWSDFAIRLDNEISNKKSGTDWYGNNLNIIICTHKYYYGNIAIGVNLLRAHIDRYNRSKIIFNNYDDLRMNCFQAYASTDRANEAGYNARAFCDLLDNSLSMYAYSNKPGTYSYIKLKYEEQKENVYDPFLFEFNERKKKNLPCGRQ